MEDEDDTYMDVFNVGVINRDIADAGLTAHSPQVLQVYDTQIPLRTCEDKQHQEKKNIIAIVYSRNLPLHLKVLCPICRPKK